MTKGNLSLKGGKNKSTFLLLAPEINKKHRLVRKIYNIILCSTYQQKGDKKIK